ncbi:FAD-dependent oxidoreductase [Streptosporangium sp. NPDC005286]|uniref:NAD(P)/FAD-dependent oxidoreductase n=1 Tax=Streptosporangium sp. NPDC005286 TaxID=3154463 RepID=UPI0033A0A21B
MSVPIVVVGAGLAGLRVAEQLRAAGDTGLIVVIGAEAHPPYNRPPLTKDALRAGVDAAKLIFRQKPSTADVEWRLGRTVTGADLVNRTVTLDDGETLAYRGLVAATGVGPRRLPLDAPLAWRHVIRTLDDATALREELRPGARVAVLGAGFVGTEVAATAAQLGCEVHVVDPLATPLARSLGELVGSEIRRRHEEHGVTFHLGRSVTAMTGRDDRPDTIFLDDSSALPADVVVEAVGSAPNVAWLEGNGLALGNGITCDVHLHPLGPDGPVHDVVAVGDVANFPNPLFSAEPQRIEHWSWPTETAGHAARSLLAKIALDPPSGTAFTPLPTFWTDQYGTRIQSLGMPGLGLEDVRVLEGEPTGECAIGYHVDGRLVGVALIGLVRQLLAYRTQLLDARAIAVA